MFEDQVDDDVDRFAETVCARASDFRIRHTTPAAVSVTAHLGPPDDAVILIRGHRDEW